MAGLDGQILCAFVFGFLGTDLKKLIADYNYKND